SALMALSDVAARNAKPGKKMYKLTDDQDFFPLVNCNLVLKDFRSRTGDLNLGGGMQNFKTTYEDKMICFSKKKVMLLCKRNNNSGWYGDIFNTKGHFLWHILFIWFYEVRIRD
ncbi:hypothetical protein Q4R39_13170, partial [Morganella morganii]